MVPRGVLRVSLAAALALSLCAPAFAEDAPDGPAATVAHAEQLILSGAPAAGMNPNPALAASDFRTARGRGKAAGSAGSAVFAAAAALPNSASS